MKKIILVAVVSLLSFNSFAQNQDSQTLNRQIVALYGQSKFDEAIPLAEKVVENEKRAARDSEIYAAALTNLAVLHKERYRILKKQIDNTSPQESRNLFSKVDEDGKEIETLLRATLNVYKKLAHEETPAAATVKNELAWILNDYSTARSTEEARARIDEAEKLYGEALATEEKTAGVESDAALKTALAFGEFYTKWINFEKALPFYERYIAAIEKKYGQNNRALIPALRGTAEILAVTNRQSDADAVKTRIASLTGKAESIPAPNPNLALRARKIERVSSKKFVPPEQSRNPGYLLSYAYGSGAMSMMGNVRVRYVQVNIVVDENGNVVEAKAETDLKDKTEIEAAALKSTFRPFSYRGTPQKMRGSISYAYLE